MLCVFIRRRKPTNDLYALKISRNSFSMQASKFLDTIPFGISSSSQSLVLVHCSSLVSKLPTFSPLLDQTSERSTFASSLKKKSTLAYMKQKNYEPSKPTFKRKGGRVKTSAMKKTRKLILDKSDESNRSDSPIKAKLETVLLHLQPKRKCYPSYIEFIRFIEGHLKCFPDLDTLS
ncbi:hypothetical protein RJT34_01105 [Clitoria ternatea]|uniref:Uncharacterized protein n=1 Tax=Clitoria ternatea TaxID=43366 RepID=A0AAN9KHU8_CLITE